MEIENVLQQQQELLAQLIQMVAENNQKLTKMDQRFDSMDQRLDSMDQKLDSMDQRLDQVEQQTAKIDAIEQKLDKLSSRLEELEVKIRSLFPSSVTDDVYLEKNLDQSKIILSQYNNTGDTVYYSAEVELTRGGFAVTSWIDIELPTLDVLLDEVKAAAVATGRPELASEIQAVEDAIGTTVDLSVKIAALQSLLNALSNL
ncbi:hypothetical protein [Paenibacillus lentus]|uniref:t-SNARE coiled-coil homology domain-containing protein n=1 Tax=Paenibacillus lentus TaxID=1338368 RepID=A0A3Q8SA71_9BACL|nr:hypothetical protein [Paenibacillus lentus]AZK45982.1 hypothetical protein EIM92_06985 [Paenibacillus lentus]